MSRGYVRTIDDMLKLYYSAAGEKYIQKADAPVLSTTTGVYNAVYGAEIWRQLNQPDTAFGLIPKVPFLRSGWRVITARGSSTVTGGQAEGAALPETLKPTFAEVSTKPKEVVHTFDVSTRQQYLAKISHDDAVGDLEALKQYWGVEHKEHIDKMLLTDVTTTANNNFESIDRVCSSYSEVNAGLCDANDADIYSLDRDAAASWADAYVNHASGTDRAITDAIYRTTISNIQINGGRTTFMLMRQDIYADTQGLYGDQARYNNPMSQLKVKPTYNGVEAVEGAEVGLNVATIYGLPVFQDVNVPTDTKGRVYFLDTSNPEGFSGGRLRFEVSQPPSYYESKDFFSIDKLAHEGMYMTGGELKCAFFGAQGKIRDLL